MSLMAGSARTPHSGVPPSATPGMCGTAFVGTWSRTDVEGWNLPGSGGT